MARAAAERQAVSLRDSPSGSACRRATRRSTIGTSCATPIAAITRVAYTATIDDADTLKLISFEMPRKNGVYQLITETAPQASMRNCSLGCKPSNSLSPTLRRTIGSTRACSKTPLSVRTTTIATLAYHFGLSNCPGLSIQYWMKKLIPDIQSRTSAHDTSCE